MAHRVVITGLGVVSSIGLGKEEFWKNCVRGTSGIQPIKRFDVSPYRSRLGGELPEFDLKQFMKPNSFRRMDRIGRMMVAGVRLAVEDSGLDLSRQDPERVGIVLGTGLGSSDTVDLFFRSLVKDGPAGAAPLLFQTAVPNAVVSHCSIEYGIKGVTLTFSHKESSAEMALGFAYHLLKEGRADIVLSGGGDELSRPLYHVYSTLGALSPGVGDSPEGMRPFSADRNGIVLGEGVGVLALETWEHAEKRGAAAYAEVAGFGLSGSTDGVLRYDAKGNSIARAMSLACPEPLVDHICAAANSTPVLDSSEAYAIRSVFHERPTEIAVSSLKSMLGEFDGSGGIRACSLALSLRHGTIPPTIGTEKVDPACDLDVVLGKARRRTIRSALLNGCSNGGSNVSLWLRSC